MTLKQSHTETAISKIQSISQVHSYLAHEISDDTVEARSGESESRLAGTQLTEVLSSLGDYISAKLHDNTPSALSTNGDIEENLGVRPVRVKYRVSFYWHLYFIMYVSSISR